MNKPTRIITLLAFSAFSAGIFAQEQTELKVTASSADGSVFAESVVDTDSSLRFSDTGVEVYSGETLVSVFPYSQTASFAFVYDKGTGVNAISDASGLRLRNNPVADMLEPIGLSAESAPLVVSDLGGVVKINVPQWKGEAINVSDLTPGLYFVTINKTTLKFIKK